MKHKRKQARTKLEEATLDEYNYLISKAMLSDRQKAILDYSLGEKRLFNYQIADKLDISPETVRDELRKIYDKIIKISENENLDEKEQLSQIIKSLYEKILVIDADSRKYTAIKVPSNEQTIYDNIDNYFSWFLSSESMYPEDIEKIKDFFNDMQHKTVIYRRKIDDKYFRVIMEMIPAENGYMLFVRNIDDIYNKELQLVQK